MKKLKIVLLYSFLIFLILFRTNIKSKYNVNDKYIKGTILSITKYDTYQKILIKGKEKIIVFSKIEDLKIGDVVECVGETKIPSKRTIFNLFDYNKYLKSIGINYTFNAKKINKIGINNSFNLFLKRKISNIIEDNPCKNYLYALILADQEKLDDDIKSTYSFNGISHLFAISGSHISILIFFLTTIFSKINILNITKKIFIFLILFIYLFVINYSISATRVILFYFFKFILKFLGINIDNTHLLIILCFLFLIYNPFLIYNQGFLFSFIISFSIIKFGNIKENKVKSNLILSLIVFSCGLIISIQSYHKINFLTPIYNLFYIPFVTFILTPSVFISFFFKPFTSILLVEVNFLEKSNIFLKEYFNFCSISLSHLSIVGIFIYLIIVLLILYFVKLKKYYIFLILVPVFIIHHNIRVFSSYQTITFIDVGQGDSILITYKNRTSASLIDTGGIYNKKGSISKNIISYLDSIGINSIDYLILSHGDYDHMGEAINLVNNYKVEKVILNCGEFNDLEKELIKVLDKKNIKYYSCIKELNIDNNKLYFLQTKEYNNENDNSNVIYTELNNYKFLFMGDASSTTEKEILNKYNLPDIDVLKVGHHGSRTSSSEEFINRINPKYSIISVGKNNRYGHPNKEVLENLEDSNVYRTDKDGSIMFKIKNSKLKIETCSP
ncbi:MAG: DNA internalization-related competence protein ComEC/Rec2 [Bacilli bacterium]|nr:DNA internalization-related competence protein ComEC/Rec2 [Bacilli bacterium]